MPNSFEESPKERGLEVLSKLSALEGKSKRRAFIIFGYSIETDEGGLGYVKEDVEKFYSKYPNKSAFELKAKDILDKLISQRPDDQKRKEEFEEVMKKFIEAFYG